MKNKNWLIVALLVLLWTIGLAASETFDGYLHLLVIAALVMASVLFLQGRRQDYDGENRSEGEL